MRFSRTLLIVAIIIILGIATALWLTIQQGERTPSPGNNSEQIVYPSDSTEEDNNDSIKDNNNENQ